jgi:cyclohexanone monooxygenase
MKSMLSVGIIGAGPGGIALGILVARAGFRDFTIFDREDGVGGTRRINTYPGLACDVKSHLYSYSFDLNPHWSDFTFQAPAECVPDASMALDKGSR